MTRNSGSSQTKNFWMTTGVLAILVAVVGAVGGLLTGGKGRDVVNPIPSPSVNPSQGTVLPTHCAPEMTLSPKEGGSTTKFTVDGRGFQPNKQVNILIGTWVSPGPGYTGDSGRFTTVVQPDPLSPGSHEVRAAHINFIPPECQATATYIVR